MNNMDQRMARLEAEGQRMVELGVMSEKQLRLEVGQLLKRVCELQSGVETRNFGDLAFALAELRGEMGLLMRECELRELRNIQG